MLATEQRSTATSNGTYGSFARGGRGDAASGTSNRRPSYMRSTSRHTSPPAGGGWRASVYGTNVRRQTSVEPSLLGRSSSPPRHTSRYPTRQASVSLASTSSNTRASSLSRGGGGSLSLGTGTLEYSTHPTRSSTYEYRTRPPPRLDVTDGRVNLTTQGSGVGRRSFVRRDSLVRDLIHGYESLDSRSRTSTTSGSSAASDLTGPSRLSSGRRGDTGTTRYHQLLVENSTSTKPHQPQVRRIPISLENGGGLTSPPAGRQYGGRTSPTPAGRQYGGRTSPTPAGRQYGGRTSPPAGRHYGAPGALQLTNGEPAEDEQVDVLPGISPASTSLISDDLNQMTISRPRRPRHTDSAENGLVGLKNIGNTCFMNSVLQSLSNTPPLLDYWLTGDYEDDINTTTSSMKGSLARSFAGLVATLWKPDSSVEAALNPSQFKSSVQKFAPRFMGYLQQDSQEFLCYLLEGIHEDLNRVRHRRRAAAPHDDDDDLLDKRPESVKAKEAWGRYLNSDDSRVVDVFVGQLKSTLECCTCHHQSVTFDPFWDLSLPIPKSSSSVTLSDCFRMFTREEVLDDDEQPTCAACKTKRRSLKSLALQRFPRVLVLHLKRFSQQRYRSKLSTLVTFPLARLDLSHFASTTYQGSSPVYDLYAVVNHSGGTHSGHYTAYIRHPYSAQWHEYNDSRVSKMSSKQVVSEEAYLLFYIQASSQLSRL